MMKFVYDILLNFNDTKPYNFYEWSVDDDIEYFKKIPLFKVNNDIYMKIVIGSVITDKGFLDKINHLTELYDKKRIRRIPYACLITNGKEVKAVLLNKGGKIIMISKMLVDEEDETLDISYALNEQYMEVDGSGWNDSAQPVFLTRLERKKMFFLNKEVNLLYDDKNIDKLKYLYYECFNEMEENIDIIYDKFNQFLKNEWTDKHSALYDLIRLSYSKK